MSERKGTKALELWCKRLIKDCPNVQIDNMTSSWRNGIAFCALVNHFRPDLIDVSKLQPDNIFENNQLAFSLAEKHLGIPALLDPEDMVSNEVPDRLSILTYLSQFYQRLGHTVKLKEKENEQVGSPTASQSPTTFSAFNNFGKAGIEKCASCDLPVYLAQRLMVSHKMYHRRCFRCSKCAGHLDPNNYNNFAGAEFLCDSCKTETDMAKFLNESDNEAQMGMLAFTEAPDNLDISNQELRQTVENQKSRPRPLSILDKINMFENNSVKDELSIRLDKLNITDTAQTKLDNSSISNSISAYSHLENPKRDKPASDEINKIGLDEDQTDKLNGDYVNKTDSKKKLFVQTQLDDNEGSGDVKVMTDCIDHKIDTGKNCDNNDIKNLTVNENESNINESDLTNLSIILNSSQDVNNTDTEINISIPPRRKKKADTNIKAAQTVSDTLEEYPDSLNPFADDEEVDTTTDTKPNSTNPFGSSDEFDDEKDKEQHATETKEETNRKQVIKAYKNPFWSEDEDATSGEENQSKKMVIQANPFNSEDDTSEDEANSTQTPKCNKSTPRRRKGKAPPPPPPPPAITVSGADHSTPNKSLEEDRCSLMSVNSYNSTATSEHKSLGLSPLRKKRPAPTPPESVSTFSDCGTGSLERGMDSTGTREDDEVIPVRKRPAPGLPLPSRRAVPALPAAALQQQLDTLDAQQLGLERQGVRLERLIRDKCEGKEAGTVDQEEVEDLVIQLCELVNEKNDLFRKQTELMYLRRQQRLEQEQADIEHEIRIMQSRPSVNRIDADKAREEELVSRLVDIVRLRDEIVQQLDAERRRERQEDLAIAASIASKRAQRNSDSNISSSKSTEGNSPKKKMKDKMKKQFKKAKHTLIPKKKETAEKKKDDESSQGKEK